MSTYVEVEEFHDQLPGSPGFSPPADQGRLAERIQLKLAEVNRCHQSVSTGITTLMRTAWEVGDLLVEARGLCAHGQWMAWLQRHVPGLSYSTANRYVKLRENFPSVESLPDSLATASRHAAALTGGRAGKDAGGRPGEERGAGRRTPTARGLAERKNPRGCRAVHIMPQVFAFVKTAGSLEEAISEVAEVAEQLGQDDFDCLHCSWAKLKARLKQLAAVLRPR